MFYRLVDNKAVEEFNTLPEFHPDVMTTIIESAISPQNDEVWGGSGWVTDIVAVELKARNNKKAEIKTEGLIRISSHLPEVDTIEELETLRKFAPAFALSAAGQSAKDVYIYALTRIGQAETAPIDDVVAYNPVTDTNWPV